jgi:hypothetical protein
VAEIILDFQKFYVPGGKFVNDQSSLTIADLAITPLFYLLEFMVQSKQFAIPLEAAAYVQRVEKASPGLVLARQPWDGFLKSFFASTSAAAAASSASQAANANTAVAAPSPAAASSPARTATSSTSSGAGAGAGAGNASATPEKRA